MINKTLCLIKIIEFLYNNTDDEHDTTAEEIRMHLANLGITIGHRTIDLYVKSLQDAGFDIIRYLGTQYRYHIGERIFDTAEIKLLIDAVQAAKFLTNKQSERLIKKLAGFTSKYEGNKLISNTYIDKRNKNCNKSVVRTIDLINSSINNRKTLCFQYYYFDQYKNKCLKHSGLVYSFCPYDLVWVEDAYYVLGYSYAKHHQRIVKFRIDRICNAKECSLPYKKRPADYNPEKYFKQVFSMYDGPLCKVELICQNDMMNLIIDKFGVKIATKEYDKEHFIAEVQICASPTFFSWIFIFAGRIRIKSPNNIIKLYDEMLNAANQL